MDNKIKIAPGSKIAILADFHGNPIALDAVLADITEKFEVDSYWLLGDYAALGHDPAGVLERIHSLPNAHFIRGNTDRYVITGELPYPQLGDTLNNPELFEHHVLIARSFAWTAGAVSRNGWLDWMRKLPLELWFLLPDGTRTLLVHASPGEDDGDGLHPGMTDAEIQGKIKNVDADLLLIGHTHLPFYRTVDGLRIVNPGSVSNPIAPDTRACYAIMTIDATSYKIELYRVVFDLNATITATKIRQHPSRRYIEEFMTGKRRPEWEKK